MAKKAVRKTTKKASNKRWSKKVTETSDAMTLDDGGIQEDAPRNSAILKAIGRTKYPQKINTVPVCDVHADVL